MQCSVCFRYFVFNRQKGFKVCTIYWWHTNNTQFWNILLVCLFVYCQILKWTTLYNIQWKCYQIHKTYLLMSVESELYHQLFVYIPNSSLVVWSYWGPALIQRPALFCQTQSTSSFWSCSYPQISTSSKSHVACLSSDGGVSLKKRDLSQKDCRIYRGTVGICPCYSFGSVSLGYWPQKNWRSMYCRA